MRVFLIPLSSHFWIRKFEAVKWEKSIFWARESCMNGTVGFIGILAIENSRQYLLLLTDILHKAVDGFPSSLHRFRLQRDSCLFVCLFVFCRCLSSVSCWRGCLRFAKRCSLCSAVCCCLLLRCWKMFSGEDLHPVGESSVVMLAFVAFNCSLFTDGNHCFANAEQTTLSHE